MKRGSDDDLEAPANKTPRREEDDDCSKSGGRIGRIRKKSAKVLEMEEFEEIEKKQFTKKSDPKAKTPLSPSSLGGPKKAKGKGGTEEVTAGASPPLPVDSLSPGMVLPNPSIISEPVTLSLPVKASTKQAIGAKVNKAQGSVIKLLLSSPTIPTTPSVSTNVITKTSPPTSISASTASIISVPTPTTTTKKNTMKVKVELALDPGGLSSEEDLSGGMTLKSELIDPQAGHLMLATSLAPDIISTPQAVVKAEPSGTLATDSLGSLKLKLMMSPKDTPKIEPAIPTSGTLPTVSALKSEKPDTPGSGGGTTTKKKAAPKKKKPAEEKASKKGGAKSAAEQMPNLAALVSTPKQPPKVLKEERNLSLSDGMDASLSDTSLDMSSIVESALDMEEEAGLVIAEGNLAPAKPKKKRAGGGGGGKKKSAKAQAAAAAAAAAAAMDLQGLDSDEGMSAPPEGDIAALAAKVQRSSGATAGGKKKASKKSLEQQEALAQDKKKRPSRRAPTAYMLYCNSQRPKVVAESPGIDFAQISRTLGVMWQCLSKKEKMMWRRKSKKLAGKGSTLISTGKGSKKESSAASSLQVSSSQAVSRPPAAAKASRASASAVSPALAGEDTPQSPVKGFGTEPIDIAAHLKLLGESLSIIGNRLQEHKGLIAVQGSLSVLLDSMLCACGPLLALTHQVPGLDGCSESTHSRTLDSVAYIMPGL
ncbi:hypothetical protein ACOMHN_003124 [Nucella lapillus]